MKKIAYLSFIVSLSVGLFFSNVYAIDSATDQEIQRLIAESLYEESLQLETHKAEKRIIENWPTSQPDGAQAVEFSWFSDIFNTYLWRDTTKNIWVKIDPLGEKVFVCRLNFFIYQEGMFQLNDRSTTIVAITDSSNSSLCEYISEPSIYKLSVSSSYEDKVNLNQEFKLYFDTSLTTPKETSPYISITAAESSLLEKDSDALFSWAEETYPALFPANGEASKTSGKWYYRSYTVSNNRQRASNYTDTHYVGTNTENSTIAYMLGDKHLVSAGVLLELMKNAGITPGTLSCYPGVHQKEVCGVAHSTEAYTVRGCMSTQEWGSRSYCQVQKCEPGYHVVAGISCSEGEEEDEPEPEPTPECTSGQSETVSCSISNGFGSKTRSCSSSGNWGSYGSCYVSSCNSGYAISGNSCVATATPSPAPTPTTSTGIYGVCSYKHLDQEGYNYGVWYSFVGRTAHRSPHYITPKIFTNC